MVDILNVIIYLFVLGVLWAVVHRVEDPNRELQQDIMFLSCSVAWTTIWFTIFYGG